jgi:hypothetical protein
MAIDSINKRRSAVTNLFLNVHPTADDAITAGDRLIISGLYGGFIAGVPPVTVPYEVHVPDRLSARPLKIVESKEHDLWMSSDSVLNWKVNMTRWFPSAETLSEPEVIVTTAAQVEIEGVVSEVETSGLSVLFKLSGLPVGDHILYVKATSDTGQTDECYGNLKVPY